MSIRENWKTEEKKYEMYFGLERVMNVQQKRSVVVRVFNFKKTSFRI